MSQAEPPNLSMSRVDRAGRTLREWWTDPDTSVSREIYEALDVVEQYRAMHARPLLLVTNGLRDLVSRHAGGGRVGQRSKRWHRIVDKLDRFPHMRLAQMEDVAGCRAILVDDASVTKVRARIRKNWEVVREDAYDEEPKPTGYRARHIVVRRRGRLVEIQLRTPEQHLWAEEVERTDARLRLNLKDGEGPRPLQEYFTLVAEILHCRAREIEIPEATRRRLATLMPRVEEYFGN